MSEHMAGEPITDLAGVTMEACGQMIELVFTEDSVCNPKIEKTILREMRYAYEYFFEIMGTMFPISRKWYIDINTRKGMGALGSFMQIPLEWVLQMADPEILVDQRELIRSLFVHELVHNFTDNEDLPMFIEMLYEAEHGQFGRIDKIRDFYDARNHLDAVTKLGPSYVRGIERIASWFECAPEEVFERFKREEPNQLKSIFREELEAHCRAERILF